MHRSQVHSVHEEALSGSRFEQVLFVALPCFPS
jgi:hypothetical protein